jgi:predicted ATPase
MLDHRSSKQGAMAESSYKQAIATAHAQQAKLFELRASTGLARLYHAQGKRGAHETLKSVLSSFTEGFATKDVLEAQSLLSSS